MAVSCQKNSDIHGSVSKGSMEDFDHSCEPCLAIGQHTEAHGFCADCQEYMCETCFACHQRTNSSKHHQLLKEDNIGKDNVRSKDLVVCTEKCPIHKNAIIKFFCTNHEFFGCTDCITLEHSMCTFDYIPDKCASIGDSDEYRETMKELEQKMKDTDAVIEKATLQDKEIDSSHENIIQEIVKFRKEINDRLDQLQKQIQTDAKKKNFKDKQTVKNVLDTCAAVSSNIKKFQSDLQDYKDSKQNGQLYILIKQAKSKLKLDDLKNAQESLDKTFDQYTFERNKELETLLTKQSMFGKLSMSSTLTKKEQQGVSTSLVNSDKLTHMGDINVMTRSDKEKCLIRGCAVLSSDKVILVDNSNNKLKVVDTQSKLVTEEKSLDSAPWDIAVLPKDQIAVTMPGKEEILVMSTAVEVSIIQKFPVEGDCRGIIFHQGQLYVVCWDPDCVFVVDTQGNVNKMISLNNDIIGCPNYMLLSEDARHIYISDCCNQSVVCVTLQGDVSAIYKHKDLYSPLGMVMLDDGSFLVCCMDTDTIHHISGDLKQGQTILDGLQLPQSICYNRQEQKVYIGGYCDQLKIMKYH